MTSHRKAANRALWVMGLVVLLVVIASGAVVAITSASDSPAPLSPVTTTATATATTTATVTATPTSDRVAGAFGTKPLANMTGGERVLYAESNRLRQLCLFTQWGGSIDYSYIRCGTRVLYVKTGFLTPVEPGLRH